MPPAPHPQLLVSCGPGLFLAIAICGKWFVGTLPTHLTERPGEDVRVSGVAAPSSGMRVTGLRFIPPSFLPAEPCPSPPCRALPFPGPCPAPPGGPGTRTGPPLPRRAAPLSPRARTSPAWTRTGLPSHVLTPAGTMTGRDSRPRGQNRTTSPHPRARSGQSSGERGSSVGAFFISNTSMACAVVRPQARSGPQPPPSLCWYGPRPRDPLPSGCEEA